MSTEVRVPTLGESVTEATVATWFKKPGDAVAIDEMLCELETDKVTVEVPSPVAGTLSEIVAAEGETVGVDALLAQVSEGDAPAKSDGGSDAAGPADEEGKGDTDATADYGSSDGDKPDPEDTKAQAGPAEVKPRDPDDAPSAQKMMAENDLKSGDVKGTGKDGRVMKEDVLKALSDPKPADAPSAQKMMAENDLKSGDVKGTGKDGRVMKEDVLKALSDPKPADAPKSAPRAPVAADDESREERVKMTRLRQTIARRLKEAQNTAAMLTTYNEVDMGAVMDLRTEYKDLFLKKHGVKLGFMSFFTKACCHALREVPDVNAEIDGDHVVYKDYVHMGIAVGTPTGLVVPVIRDADAMGFAEIEQAINDMGAKARDGKLSMADMQGGSFTISNGGVYGSLMSSPILNPPQSGILGMHKIQDRPMVVGGEIVIRPMMYLALSYDHRIVDGKGAVTFLVRVKEALEDPRRLLMDL